HALRQGLRDVLGGLPPQAAAEEQRFAVFPLTGGAVEDPGRGRHREVRNRRTGRGEPQFRIGGEVADHRDYCFTSHFWPPLLPRRMDGFRCVARSEEHTSELQSRENLVCRLL